MGMKVNGTTGLTFPDTTTLGSAGQSSVQAWVNFNGTGTVAIRANFNVSSITDNGVGDYTVNFTTAMQDANYAVVGGWGISGVTGANQTGFGEHRTRSTTAVSVYTTNLNVATFLDPAFVNVAIFR